jgi:hypothetical protein
MSNVLNEKSVRRSLTGSVTSQGDRAIYADQARAMFAVNGSGIVIGVIGDSFNCKGGARNDTLTGDLPMNVTILRDLNPTQCQQAGKPLFPVDQGRAMMQVMHDVAPGARFVFRSAIVGAADMAVGIQELATAGCNIIVPAVYYATEPFFQDGILAQAVDQVASQGVSFFSLAGDNGRQAWDGVFVPVQVNTTSLAINGTNASTVYHQFGIGDNGIPIISQLIRVPNPSIASIPVLFVLQWDEPFFTLSGGSGCQVDLDLYLIYENNVIAKSQTGNVGRDAVEVIEFNPKQYSNITDNYVTVEMVIIKRQGLSPKFMKLIPFAPFLPADFEFATNSPTIVGMSNAALGASVGATFSFETLAFGNSRLRISDHSCRWGSNFV